MTTFYVDAVSGSDLNDGLSPETAWRSADFVSQHQFQPGDSILFRAGERFIDDPLTINSRGAAEAPITIGRYGEGANPVFDGTLDLLPATWTETSPGSHVWQTHLPLGGPDPRKFLIDGTLQIESGALGDLDQPGEWHYQTTGRVLSLYSVGDPSTTYSSLDIQYRQFMIKLSGAEHVVVRDIDATMARYGVQLDGAQHVQIIDFNGYGNVLGGIGILNGSDHNIVVGGTDHDNGVPGYEHHLTTKLGSGIFINNSSDNVVEGVRLFDNFEDGLQFGGPAGGSGNVVRDCVVYGNLEDGFDIKSGDQSVIETLVFGNRESGLNHNANSTVTLFGNVVDSPNTNRGLSLDTGKAGRFDSIDNTYADGRQTTAAITSSQPSTFLGDVFFAASNQKVLAITAGPGTSITDSVVMLQSGSDALLASAAAANLSLLGNVFFTQGGFDLHYAPGMIAASDRNLFANASSPKNWIRVGSVTYTQADLASGRYAAVTQLDTHSQVAALSLATDPSGRLVLTDGTRVLAVVTDPHALDVPPDRRLVGGEAGDTLGGGPGFDILYGHGGNDRLLGKGGDDKAYGDDGDDTLEGNAGADRLYGGAGNDRLLGGVGEDRLYGQAGDDTLEGGADDDRLYGGDGADSLRGGGDNDRLYGLAGDDTLLGENGADLLRGGAGSDSLDGGRGGDSLDGSEGADILAGGTGNDLLDGGAQADTMRGGAGDDTYIVDDAGDLILETEPDSGADSSGTDLVEASVSFTLPAFVEKLVLGGVGDLSGTGNELANGITGNPGANNLEGLGGSDTLVGGDGSDTLDGGSGADLMYGGAGDDTYLVDDPADQAMEADPGTDLDSGGADTVNASVSFTIEPFIEILRLTGTADIAGTGNDADNKITGNSGANTLAGAGGDDTLSGAAGADLLSGDDGADSLAGGGGDDTLLGGLEADKLDGGDGVDLMYGGDGNDVYT
ncbi:MAG: right-handed parallel beta-helix repeat-containing protein, partial [Rhodospirillaceae bacterium]|nr:right-handed parallel beta-helix repeat-containing protein [Rhodospirillaceae bacterium]